MTVAVPIIYSETKIQYIFRNYTNTEFKIMISYIKRVSHINKTIFTGLNAFVFDFPTFQTLYNIYGHGQVKMSRVQQVIVITITCWPRNNRE